MNPCPPQTTRPRVSRAAACFFLATLLSAAPGCEIFGFFLNGLFPSKVKARYRLEDRPTLVLIDDPHNALEDPTLSDQIANQAASYLIQERVLSKTNAIPPDGLYALKTRLGRGYARTPIDRIGRSLNADQVIHILIKSTAVVDSPGLLRPTAIVQVKVIDATTGKRLYPAPDPENPALTVNNHHTVNSVMPHRGDSSGDPGVIKEARRNLALRIARDTARIFFDYLPRQPGQPFEK